LSTPIEPLPYHYVAVDGPIGVGKTTLVELLTRRLEGVKLLEDVDNPFLPEFYREKEGSAFQTELYFLLTRFKQQQDAMQRDLFDRLLLADYTFQKNRIFAYLNLDDSELLLFDKLFALLEPQVPHPDLVIYLVADVQTCLARIKRRRLASKEGTSAPHLDALYEAEKGIAPEYLSELIDAYNHYYHYYQRTPLLVVDTRHLDFPARPEDLDELVHRLARPIKGTEYFVPLGSAR
jgi:deoxyadenosine/deoxycytidine kinase